MLSMICDVAFSASERVIGLLPRMAENMDAKAAALSVISDEVTARSVCAAFSANQTRKWQRFHATSALPPKPDISRVLRCRAMRRRDLSRSAKVSRYHPSGPPCCDPLSFVPRTSLGFPTPCEKHKGCDAQLRGF